MGTGESIGVRRQGEGTFLVPEPPPDPRAASGAVWGHAQGPAGPNVPWNLDLRDKVAAGLAARGIGPLGLAGFALAPAAIGALALATAHPGIAAILGTAAALLAWLAIAPGADGRIPALAGLVSHALMPLWLGGLVVDAAGSGASALAALAAWTSFVLLLLPLVRAEHGAARLTSGPLLWSWGERAAALLLGVFLGRAGLAMFATACVTTADLVLRMIVLHPLPDGRTRLPPGLTSLFGPDGAPTAGVRLTLRLALAAFAVLLVLFGTSADWRF